MRCSYCTALQCAAVCCSALEYIAVRCCALQRVAMRCSLLRCVAALDYHTTASERGHVGAALIFVRIAVHYSVAVCCSHVMHVAVCCSARASLHYSWRGGVGGAVTSSSANVCCSMLQCVAACCSHVICVVVYVLQPCAVLCVLQVCLWRQMPCCSRLCCSTSLAV